MDTPHFLTPEQLKALAEQQHCRTALDVRATRMIVTEFGTRLGVETARIVEQKQ